MSFAKQCDICGTYFTPKEYDRHSKYENGRPIQVITLHTFGIESSLDICPGCEIKLKDFIGEKSILK